MSLIIQEPNLIKLKDVKFGQIFKVQSYTTSTEGKYFVKAKNMQYIPTETIYISLKNFYSYHLDDESLVYLMDADIVIKDIIPKENK